MKTSSFFWSLKKQAYKVNQICLAKLAINNIGGIGMKKVTSFIIVASAIFLILVILTGCPSSFPPSIELMPDISFAKYLGGSDDEARSIQQTSDGGYIVAGYTGSNDGDVSGNHGRGSFDYWIVKLDETGKIQWQKCLGGSSYDEAYSIQQTSDGGYIVAGYTGSNDGDVSGNHGYTDYWVVKLDY